MSSNLINVRLKHAVATEAEWAAADPIPQTGELIYSSDKNYAYKIGNGTSKWSELPYFCHLLNTDAGDENTPIYLENGTAKPVTVNQKDVLVTLNSGDLPSFEMSVSNEILDFDFSAGTKTTAESEKISVL